jgi:hypothetical protein
LNPAEEDDIENQRFFGEANFYCKLHGVHLDRPAQVVADTHLDVLWKWHKKTGVEWVDSRPSFILGVSMLGEFTRS